MTDQLLDDRERQTQHLLDGSFRLVILLAAACGLLAFAVTVIRGLDGSGADGSAPSSGAVAGRVEVFGSPAPAPAITLTDQDGRPFSLASLRGSPVFVFFGYTHCPDVCPVTVGRVGMAMTAFGSGVRALFVTVDPARDTVPWLKEYVRYLAPGYTAVTGSELAIRATADAWGVRYAKEQETAPGVYSMSHTADLYLVDANGLLRARLPFGTEPETMTAVLRQVVATTAPSSPSAAPTGPPVATASPSASASPSATPSTAPANDLSVTVVSSSVWAGPETPVILTLAAGGAPVDAAANVTVQLIDANGGPTGSPVTARAVQPPGVPVVSFVATLAVPTPGRWILSVTAAGTSGAAVGQTEVLALDPGGTAAIGSAAPTVRTPTAADSPDLRTITTDEMPDERLYQTSVPDALGAGRPFVLVIDSPRFRVSSACGKALALAQYLQDRWPNQLFIHVEPYRYSIVTDTPTLDGSLDDPPLTDAAAGWGIGAAPWGARSMPWVFIVDGHGIVRAKYQGVMGSADLDVLITMLGG